VTIPLLGRLPNGAPAALAAIFADPDGDALQIEVTTRPDREKGKLVVDAATGAAMFTPSRKFKQGLVIFFVRAREVASEGLASQEAFIRIQYGGRWGRTDGGRSRGPGGGAAGPGRPAGRSLFWAMAKPGPARQPERRRCGAAVSQDAL
jgi:hypothetical protein